MDSNKNKYGEVMTPHILINELLDNLPKSVWSNPALSWLDPCAGTGNFFLLVYQRLILGLAKKIPNINTRKTHIAKMLYMIELNPKNIRRLKNEFSKLINPGNIIHADFLQTTAFDSKKFDIILANPPYQVEKTETYKGSQGSAKILWDKFILKSLDLLAPDGYMGFITPANWRRPNHPLYKKMVQENTLEYLHIYGKAQGRAIFGVDTRFDIYIIRKQPSKIKTKIIDEKGKTHNILAQKWPFLPNYCYNEIKAILAKPGENSLNIIFSSSLYDARKLCMKKTAKCRYPVVHTMTKKGLGLRYTMKNSLFKNENTKNDPNTQFGTPKVLLNFNEKLYPYNDYKGEYGMSQLTFGIPITTKEHGNKIIKALETPAFQEIIKATKWSAFQTDYRMFSYFTEGFYKDFL
jgi:SAM-dependent methyltransferase